MRRKFKIAFILFIIWILIPWWSHPLLSGIIFIADQRISLISNISSNFTKILAILLSVTFILNKVCFFGCIIFSCLGFSEKEKEAFLLSNIGKILQDCNIKLTLLKNSLSKTANLVEDDKKNIVETIQKYEKRFMALQENNQKNYAKKPLKIREAILTKTNDLYCKIVNLENSVI